jgi:hypothetical protein
MQEFMNMISMICNYRGSIDETFRIDFDNQWNFHSIISKDRNSIDPVLRYSFSRLFNTLLCRQKSTLEVLFQNLSLVSKLFSSEKKYFSREEMTDISKCYRLMHLMQRDLLPKSKACILDSHDRRISSHIAKEALFTFHFSLVIVIVMLGVYGTMLFYIFSFGNNASNSLQNQLCLTFFAWMLAEAVLVETSVIYILFVFFPSTISDKLQMTKAKILNFLKGTDVNDAYVEFPDDFNLSKYLSVSYRMTDFYSTSVLETRTIREYPFQPSYFSAEYNDMTYLSRFCSLPIECQDIFARFFTVLFYGSFIIALGETYIIVSYIPVLTFSVLVLLILAYLLMRAHNRIDILDEHEPISENENLQTFQCKFYSWDGMVSLR